MEYLSEIYKNSLSYESITYSIEVDDSSQLLNEGDSSHPPYLPNY